MTHLAQAIQPNTSRRRPSACCAVAWAVVGSVHLGCRLRFDPSSTQDGGVDGGVSADTAPVDSAPLAPTTVMLTDSAASTNNSAVYTFNAMSIGAAAPNRLVVVAALSNSPVDVSGITVGGLAATRLIVYSQGGISAIYSALVPLGTTADIAVSLANGASRCAIGVYSVLYQGGVTPTAMTSPVGWTGSSSTTVARLADGAGIWIGQRDNNNSAFTLTLDGVAPPADAAGTFSSANFYWQYGHTTPVADGTSTYAVDFGANTGAVIAAYFR